MEQSISNTPVETKKLSGPFGRAAKVLYFLLTMPVVLWVFLASLENDFPLSLKIVFGLLAFLIFTDLLLCCVNYVVCNSFKWFITIKNGIITFGILALGAIFFYGPLIQSYLPTSRDIYRDIYTDHSCSAANTVSDVDFETVSMCGSKCMRDTRDGKVYPTTRADSTGDKGCWMNGNLAYLPKKAIQVSDTKNTFTLFAEKKAVPFDHSDDNGYISSYENACTDEEIQQGTCTDANTYGLYYQWSAAMNGATSANGNPGTVQGMCPNGWHVPSKSEGKAYGFNLTDDYTWTSYSSFSPAWNYSLAGDHYPDTSGTWSNRASNEYLWSSFENSSNSWYLYFSSGNSGQAFWSSNAKANGFSLRCRKSS